MRNSRANHASRFPAMVERGRKTIPRYTRRFHAGTPRNNTVQRHRLEYNKLPSGSTGGLTKRISRTASRTRNRRVIPGYALGKSCSPIVESLSVFARRRTHPLHNSRPRPLRFRIGACRATFLSGYVRHRVEKRCKCRSYDVTLERYAPSVPGPGIWTRGNGTECRKFRTRNRIDSTDSFYPEVAFVIAD